MRASVPIKIRRLFFFTPFKIALAACSALVVNNFSNSRTDTSCDTPVISSTLASIRAVLAILVLMPPGCTQLALTLEPDISRSEEHTSELQSRPQLVCRLLLEKTNITDFF